MPGMQKSPPPELARLRSEAQTLSEQLKASRRSTTAAEAAATEAEDRCSALQVHIAVLEAAIEEHDSVAAKLQVLEGRSEDVAGERQRAARFQGVCAPTPQCLPAWTGCLIQTRPTTALAHGLTSSCAAV